MLNLNIIKMKSFDFFKFHSNALYLVLILLFVCLPTVTPDNTVSKETSAKVKDISADTTKSVDKTANVKAGSSSSGPSATTTLLTPVLDNSNSNINCSLPKNFNITKCLDKDKDNGVMTYFINKMSSNSGMLFRTMYVLLAVTGIVIVYFVIKAIRLRRRKSKSRKYGIITKQGDRGDMEMEPLGDGMDEDDDYTVFEMGRRK